MDHLQEKDLQEGEQSQQEQRGSDGGATVGGCTRAGHVAELGIPGQLTGASNIETVHSAVSNLTRSEIIVGVGIGVGLLNEVAEEDVGGSRRTGNSDGGRPGEEAQRSSGIT